MYVQRNIKKELKKILETYPIIALVGARQSGKTTFLKEEVPKSEFSYLLFDDPDIKEIFEKDIKAFEKQYLSKKKISILDEIHYCEDAGRKLKYLADSGYRLWITSSSEMILNEKVLSYLVGRVSILRLYPFSLDEFLRAKKQKTLNDKILQRTISEHITFGGYPKVVLNEDKELKQIILKDIYNTMILKDVVNTFSIKDINNLERFVKYLANIIGNLVSYDKISNSLNMPFQTIKKYVDALEKSYLIIRIRPFYTNKIKEIVKQPKIYFIDSGLKNAIINNFERKITGEDFENYVLMELIKSGKSVKYWRTKTKSEVDFIIEKGRDIIPIEVKLKSKIGKIEPSLRSFIKKYNPKKAFIVNYNGEKGEVEVNGCRIFYTTLPELKSKI